ncbi:MAG: hypothetical protein Q9219_002430 [cf. Caloplaca sp. 3 TL-2023]
MAKRPDVDVSSDSDSDLLSVEDLDFPKESIKEPKIKQEIPEGFAEVVRTDHNLRRRNAVDYVAPWLSARRRKRVKKSTIHAEDQLKDEIDNAEDPVEVLSAQSERSSDDPLVMLYKAAVLLGRNEIPCNAFGCPIKGPHGEGLYLHPKEVPNSKQANAFFFPSIPPPSVVEAYNKVRSKPPSADLDVGRKFYDYHTAPCHPSKHLVKVGKFRCRSKNCGVQGPHQKGAYLHHGLDASLNQAQRVKYIFGISNPPPEIWDAAVRGQDGVGSKSDDDLVEDFMAHHVRLEKGATDVEEFKEMQKQRKAKRP